MPADKDEIINEMARLIVCAARAAYSNTLVGNPAPVVEAYYRRADSPVAGDIVCEITALGRARPVAGKAPIVKWTQHVGRLLKVEQEPYPDWDEELNEEPAPCRAVWYIETLDGETVTWENCHFIVVPSDLRGSLGWQD